MTERQDGLRRVESSTVDLDVLQQRLQDVGVLVQLSKDAYFGVPTRHGFKVGYVFLTTREMEEGLEKAAGEINRQTH